MHLKFSQDIESILHRLSCHSLTLHDILLETSERGFSLLIALFVLPFLLPMPPGLAGVFGLGSLLLSLQMALGRREPWLPKKVANFKFPKSASRQLLKQIRRLTKLIEKITRPRLLIIANNPYISRINGLCMAWLTLLLMLPIPFTNPLPAIGILLLAVATLEADGLLMCIAYIWSFAITMLLIFMSYAFLQIADILPNLF